MSEAARDRISVGGEASVGPDAGDILRPLPPPSVDKLEELRSLLTKEERRRLDALEAAELDADELAELLPDAILRRERRDDRISRALEQTIEGGLFKSARRDPQSLADAIHPALGPAIRSMIQASLRQSLEKFNVALENSLSPQGLRWRIQAARTGQSFSEVVLLNTLLYRVEQVLLVHRGTGLLIAEARGSEAPERDADLVAGMLSAIRDFGADSMGTDAGEGPREIDFEGLTLTLTSIPGATVALVVRGNPPKELHERALQTAEAVHVGYAEELEAFNGDATPLAGAVPLLEDLLDSAEKPREKSKLLRLIPIGIGALVIAAMMYGGWASRRSSDDLLRVRDALRDIPGVVVHSVEIVDGDLVVRGLSDPLAGRVEDRVALALEGRGRDFAVMMEPFASLAPSMVCTRVRQAFGLGSEVSLSLTGGVLSVGGLDPLSAPAQELARSVSLLAGVDALVFAP